MALQRLLAGIELTKLATEREVAGAAEHVPKAIDVLLEIPRFARADTSISDEQTFRWWAIAIYVNAGHTSWALYDLWRSGLYYESTILLRNLMEALVQLRYFEGRMSEVRQLLDPATSRRFRFKDMFEAVAPGYHDKWYGYLSSAAHARIAATVFRLEPSRAAVGAQHNEFHSSAVMNQFDPVLLGLLRLFPHHFPGYPSAVDAALEARRVEEMTWLQSAFDAQVRQFPRSQDWANLVRPLIEIATPQ